MPAYHGVVMLFFAVLLCVKKIMLSEDISNMVGNSIEKWLDNIPFEGTIPNPEKGSIIIDNSEQVFPFMGKLI